MSQQDACVTRLVCRSMYSARSKSWTGSASQLFAKPEARLPWKVFTRTKRAGSVALRGTQETLVMRFSPTARSDGIDVFVRIEMVTEDSLRYLLAACADIWRQRATAQRQVRLFYEFCSSDAALILAIQYKRAAGSATQCQE